MGPFLGVVEILCGFLLLTGLLTRLSAIPVLIHIPVAIFSTKLPILLVAGAGAWSLDARFFGHKPFGASSNA